MDYGDGTVEYPVVSGMSVPLSHTYAQDGEYTVTVTVNDGELEGSSSAPLVVNNVAPTVDAGSEATILEGSVFDRTGSFTDPGADVWTATVGYGDGSGVQDPLALTGKTGKDFTLSHVYADDGVYEIIVTVSDGVADPVSATASVVVNNVAPAFEPGPDPTVIFERDGGTFVASMSFSDPGADDWTASVDYGDGTVDSHVLDGRTIDLLHTYTGNEQCGPFTVTVTVEDDDGGEDSGTTQVTFIHQILIDKASVKLDRRDRQAKDRFDVNGRLPRSLLGCLDWSDMVSVELEGLGLVIPAGALVERHGKWRFRARSRSGIHKFELRDDGRFKIQARGPFGYDLRHVDFGYPVHFSLSLGADSGEAPIQLDRRLRFRSHDDDDDDDDDDDGDDDGNNDDGHNDDDDDDDDDDRKRGRRS